MEFIKFHSAVCRISSEMKLKSQDKLHLVIQAEILLCDVMLVSNIILHSFY